MAYNRSSSCVIFSGFCILSRFVRVFGYKQNLVHVKWKEKAFCHLFFNENVISSLSICRIKLLEGTTKITHKISLYCTNLLCSSQSSKHFNRSNKTGTKIPIPWNNSFFCPGLWHYSIADTSLGSSSFEISNSDCFKSYSTESKKLIQFLRHCDNNCFLLTFCFIIFS